MLIQFLYQQQQFLTINRMLADYVMKGIDNLFSQKLKNHQSTQIIKNNSNKVQDKSNFNRETIKKSLHTIIRKGEVSRSPKSKNQKSSSGISKSRLKLILQSNKDERLRSVVKRNQNLKKETSPYKKIEVDVQGGNRAIKVSQQYQNKENNIIRYYRQMRKSTQKSQQCRKPSLKDGKKSRIFINKSILTGNLSNEELRFERI